MVEFDGYRRRAKVIVSVHAYRSLCPLNHRSCLGGRSDGDAAVSTNDGPHIQPQDVCGGPEHTWRNEVGFEARAASAPG
ncbi:hypothetical protein CEXT_708311 [Caerostris extrusa]|uniref:Uncharacterized protein n=1 Tax=Caerostris extrusa TaxID=172846 RepID=A0AAV4Q3N6_CAEEX|nr:hypothetical protein CEXT_708311 [Caerostris extrusa]